MRLLRLLVYLSAFALGIGAGAYLFIRITFAGSATTVPRVLELTLREAKGQARRARMTFRIVNYRYDLHIDKGRVVEQRPRPGMSIRNGMVLSVVLSKGVEKLKAPAFVGMRMEEARLGIQRAELQLKGVSFTHRSALFPTVIAQYPPASTIVPKDSELSLLVDAGPVFPVFVMPGLTGMDYTKVRRAFREYGITTGPARAVREQGRFPGEIVAQSPRQGSPLERTTPVQLTVNQP